MTRERITVFRPEELPDCKLELDSLLAHVKECVSGQGTDTEVYRLSIESEQYFLKVAKAQKLTKVLARNVQSKVRCSTPELEARILLRLQNLGFVTIPVLAAGSSYCGGVPENGFMLSKAVKAKSLEDLLTTHDADIAKAWRNYGWLVARLHNVGCAEPLRAKDILIVDGKQLLLDREKPVSGKSLSDKKRITSLQRLVYRNQRSGLLFDRFAHHQFFEGYAAEEKSRKGDWTAEDFRCMVVPQISIPKGNIDKPEVELSIIVPTFNHAAWLEQCVESVSAQKFSQSFELIIVDDGSTDNTPDVLRELENRFNWLRHIRQENGGPAKARNHGASQAKGRYLMFLDSDDSLVEGSLNQVFQFIDERKTLSGAFPPVVMCSYAIEDAGGGLKYKNAKLIPATKVHAFEKYIKGDIYVNQGSYLVLREAFEKITFPEELATQEDVVFFQMLFANYSVWGVDVDLYRYAKYRGSVSSDTRRNIYTGYKVVDYFMSSAATPKFFKNYKWQLLQKRTNSLLRVAIKTRDKKEVAEVFRQAKKRNWFLILSPKLLTKWIKAGVVFFKSGYQI